MAAPWWCLPGLPPSGSSPESCVALGGVALHWKKAVIQIHDSFALTLLPTSSSFVMKKKNSPAKLNGCFVSFNCYIDSTTVVILR